MFKINIADFKDICFGFYMVPNCFRNHHAKFEINRTILTCAQIFKGSEYLVQVKKEIQFADPEGGPRGQQHNSSAQDFKLVLLSYCRSVCVLVCQSVCQYDITIPIYCLKTI